MTQFLPESDIPQAALVGRGYGPYVTLGILGYDAYRPYSRERRQEVAEALRRLPAITDCMRTAFRERAVFVLRPADPDRIGLQSTTQAALARLATKHA